MHLKWTFSDGLCLNVRIWSQFRAAATFKSTYVKNCLTKYWNQDQMNPFVRNRPDPSEIWSSLWSTYFIFKVFSSLSHVCISSLFFSHPCTYLMCSTCLPVYVNTTSCLLFDCLGNTSLEVVLFFQFASYIDFVWPVWFVCLFWNVPALGLILTPKLKNMFHKPLLTFFVFRYGSVCSESLQLREPWAAWTWQEISIVVVCLSCPCGHNYQIFPQISRRWVALIWKQCAHAMKPSLTWLSGEEVPNYMRSDYCGINSSVFVLKSTPE